MATVHSEDTEKVTVKEDFNDDDDYVLIEDLDLDHDNIQQKLNDMI